MRTPDGRHFESGSARNTLAVGARAIFSGARVGGRALWRGTVIIARAIAKFVATVWRLAGALDAALWRGVKLFVGATWRGLRLVMRVGARAARDFLRWLPTRAGRAYSSFFGILWIVGMLAAVDFLINTKPSSQIAVEERAPVDLEDPILARIEGRYVHLSEVESAALASGALREGETLTPQSAFERKLVEAYVEQRLLARAAVGEGVQRSPAVARQLAAARERILAAAFMEERIATATTDEAVERLYRSQSDVTRLGDEVRARHIVVDTPDEAETVLAALRLGADFETLARELSKERSSAVLGGDLDYFTRDMMLPPLARAAFSTPVGSFAQPFQTELGWHVLQVLDRRATGPVPLQSVEENIRRFLTLRTIEKTLADLKQANEVVYYEPPPAPDGVAAGASVRPETVTQGPGG